MYKQFVSLLGATVALGGLAAGCGTREEDQVKDAWRAWATDLVAGRGPQACARLTDAGRKDFTAAVLLEARDCEVLVRAFAAQLTPTQKKFLPRITIRRVELRDDRALLHDRYVEMPPEIDELDGRDDEPTVLRRIDGRWLLEDMG